LDNLELRKDSDNKWFVFDNKNNRVVTGHIPNKEVALEWLKKLENVPDHVSKREKRERNPLSRNAQIRADRADKMGITIEEYNLRAGNSH
jgi:tetrahydrodipicolinate N-succinyltransferase